MTISFRPSWWWFHGTREYQVHCVRIYSFLLKMVNLSLQLTCWDSPSAMTRLCTGKTQTDLFLSGQHAGVQFCSPGMRKGNNHLAVFLFIFFCHIPFLDSLVLYRALAHGVTLVEKHSGSIRYMQCDVVPVTQSKKWMKSSSKERLDCADGKALSVGYCMCWHWSQRKIKSVEYMN